MRQLSSYIFKYKNLKINKFNFSLTQQISAEDKTASKFQLKNFSDQVKLQILAGKGGNGSIAYFTDKKIRKGKPDGGDGGAGGDVIVQAHQGLHDLSHLRRKNVHGVNGANGGPQGKNGKNGGKTIIRVPCGTLIYEVKNQQQTERKKFLIDLCSDKSQVIVAKGGHYGRGNKMNPSITNQTRYGGQGQNRIIHLQLKILADIGLVGFPNIGKSTFLAAVSRALPKIANYQFTTLKPSIGYVKFVDDFKMTVADIPGIIEDAHQDKGLGLQFLRHIERTKSLIVMLDMTKDPLKQYHLLLRQLKQYKNGILLQKPRIVLLNKKDCFQNQGQQNTNQTQILNQHNKSSGQHKADTIFRMCKQALVNQYVDMVSAKMGGVDQKANIGQVLIKLRQMVQIQREKQRKIAEEQLKLKRLSQIF